MERELVLLAVLGFFGSNCDAPCTCQNGACNSGVSGSGACLSCESGYIGQNCDQPCTCKNGTCDSGISGSGTCTSCNAGFYGPNCDAPCTCNGQCNSTSGNGSCISCSSLHYGPKCLKCNCNFGVCFEGINGTGRCVCNTAGICGESDGGRYMVNLFLMFSLFVILLFSVIE